MASTKNFITALILTLLLTAIAGCNLIREHQSFAQKAEAAAKAGKLDEAIDNYYEHIKARLHEKNRPDWENPYFYLLLIGDLWIEKGDTAKALEKYEEAHEHGVDALLIGDRICLLSRKLETQGRLSQAYKVLVSHHDLNPDLFDIALNRVARALSAQEESPKVSTR